MIQMPPVTTISRVTTTVVLAGRRSCTFYNLFRVGNLMECTACPATRLAPNTPRRISLERKVSTTDVLSRRSRGSSKVLYRAKTPFLIVPTSVWHPTFSLNCSRLSGIGRDSGCGRDDPTVVSRRSCGRESYWCASYCSSGFFPWRACSIGVREPDQRGAGSRRADSAGSPAPDDRMIQPP
jgi:hypothetical protein